MKNISLTTASDIIAKAKRLAEEAEAVQQYWTTTLPLEFLPEIRQCQLWLRMYGGLDNVIGGLERTQQWLQQIEQENAELEAEGKPTQITKTKLDVIKYASGVMKNLDRGIDPADKGKWMGEKPTKEEYIQQKKYEYQKRPGNWNLGEDGEGFNRG
jgi:hypothetical protein